MPDWENLRHLAAVAHAQTIAGAARALKVEHATVSRRIASLERELDLKLLDRRGRKIELTSQGRELIEALKRMQFEVDAIERLAAGKRTSLSGEVMIAAPPALGTAMLAPALVELRARHPKLMLQIMADTRQSELQRREADLAIRLNTPTDLDLQATRLGVIRFRLYASAQYLATTPEPEWVFIGYDASMDRSPQQLAMIRIADKRPIVIRANSAELQLNLVSGGAGVAMLPEFLTRNTALQPVGTVILRREAWLVVHSDMISSAAVRVVAQAVECHLRSRLTDEALEPVAIGRG